MGDSEAAKARGNEEYKRGNYTEAIRHYSDAIAASPDQHAYYGNRSAAHYMLQQYSLSLQDCVTALELQPSFQKARLRAGKCSLCIGEFDNAKSYYQTALEMEPENSAITKEAKLVETALENMHMYTQCWRNEQYPQAVYFVEQVMAVATHYTFLKLEKLNILIDSQKPKEAVDYSLSLATEFMNDTRYTFLRALAYFYNNQNDLAKRIFTDLLRMEPDNERIVRIIKTMKEMERLKEEGNRLFKAGEADSAIDLYTQALALDSKHNLFNSTILSNRAAAYMKKTDYMKALEDCNRAIGLNSEFTRAYLRRANVHMELENYEDALADYNQVKNMEPDTVDIDNYIKFAQNKAKKNSKKDYYKILGIEKGVSDAEVKKAYRQLALKWHPDKNSETPEKRAYAEKMFKDVNEAYAVLNDPQKKQRHDMGMDVDGPDFGGMPGGFGIDPTQIFSMFFGQNGFPDMGSFGGMDFGGGGGGFPGGRSGGFPGGVKFSFSRR